MTKEPVTATGDQGLTGGFNSGGAGEDGTPETPEEFSVAFRVERTIK